MYLHVSVCFVIGLHYSIITCQFSMFDVDNDIFDMRIFSVCVRRIGVTFNSLVSSVTEIDSKDTIFEVVWDFGIKSPFDLLHWSISRVVFKTGRIRNQWCGNLRWQKSNHHHKMQHAHINGISSIWASSEIQHVSTSASAFGPMNQRRWCLFVQPERWSIFDVPNCN